MISGWVGDGLKGDSLFFTERTEYLPVKWCVLGGLALGWALLAWLLDWLLLYLLPLRTLSQKKQAKPHKVLIAPVSEVALEMIDSRADGDWLVEKDSGNGQVINEAKFAGGLENLLAKFESSRRSVVPLLRSLRWHQAELRQVHFLASTQSIGFARKLKPALQSCLGADVAIEIHGEALDFEDIDNVYHALDEVVNRAINMGFHEQDIIVDLTGGQKPTSVALALYTLHRDILCQYVQTGGNKEVLQYDMALRPPTGPT